MEFSILSLFTGQPDAWPGLARALGGHVSAWYALSLVLVWGATAGGWLLTRHAALPSPGGLRRERLQAALAAGLVLLAGQTFAGIADQVQGAGGLAAFDQILTAALAAEASTATLTRFALLTRLGDTATISTACIALAALLWWRGQRGLALVWVAALAGNSLLNVSLKAVFERARPLHEHGVAVAQGWSFPSGHASGSVVLWGMLGYLALRLLPARWHLPALLVAAGMAFSVGFSRIVLQVHYFSDVLAGFCSGMAWLTLCILVAEALRRRAVRLTQPS
ncbi:phosphatase PAP2 family protein [Azoarcus sp. DD4]|uniref:phosphatase PAP2 family protein n=1 Tax=Azoarcus sp. DD4 TaxID=2027405 RepID=UPI00197AD646|nr:phosphatase PAP2 family protein [Azoarcus sp. DD4]